MAHQNANYYKGTIEFPPNLNWDIVNVLKLFKKILRPSMLYN